MVIVRGEVGGRGETTVNINQALTGSIFSVPTALAHTTHGIEALAVRLVGELPIYEVAPLFSLRMGRFMVAAQFDARCSFPFVSIFFMAR